MRLTFELVDLVKQMPSPIQVNLNKSVEGLNRIKRLSKGEFALCVITFKLGQYPSPPLDWNLYNRLSWVSSLLTAALRAFQPPQKYESIPYTESLHIYIHIYMYFIYMYSYIYVWRTKTNHMS